MLTQDIGSLENVAATPTQSRELRAGTFNSV